LKVFRTWGFNDRNRTTLTDGLPQYGGEGAGPSTNVLQWWNNGTQEINLEPLDKVVEAAEKTGMKLIVTLTNNWADYGGMDVYTINLGYKYHDDVSLPLLGLGCETNQTLTCISFTTSRRSRRHTKNTLRLS
jgi:mannan endo-1,4-beta-mannosidase